MPETSRRMRTLYILIPLFALLAAAIWFAGTTWIHLGGAMCRQDEGDDDPRD